MTTDPLRQACEKLLDETVNRPTTEELMTFAKTQRRDEMVACAEAIKARAAVKAEAIDYCEQRMKELES